MKQRKTAAPVRFATFTTVETSGVGALVALQEIALRNASVRDAHVVWLHLGVAVDYEGFRLEERAVNEATFRCADERGWAPIKQAILPQYPKSHALHPEVPLRELLERMASAKGGKAGISQDCGLFVCNWL